MIGTWIELNNLPFTHYSIKIYEIIHELDDFFLLQSVETNTIWQSKYWVRKSDTDQYTILSKREANKIKRLIKKEEQRQIKMEQLSREQYKHNGLCLSDLE